MFKDNFIHVNKYRVNFYKTVLNSEKKTCGDVIGPCSGGLVHADNFFSSFSSLYSPQKCTKYDIWEKVHVIWFWCDWLETHNSIFSLFAFLNSYETCKIGPPLEDVHSLPFGVVLYADMIVHQSLSKLEHSAQFTVLKYTLNKILNIPPYEYNLWKIAK